MEQTPSLPGRSPELPSVSSPSSQERVGAIPGPEINTGGAVERREQKGETAPAVEQTSAPPMILPPISTAAPTTDDAAVAVTTVSDDDLPTVANDDDLIEKEWVDKAKKVIASTKDDPYRREQEVNRLQADYLAKRYGRELGLSNGQ